MTCPLKWLAYRRNSWPHDNVPGHFSTALPQGVDLALYDRLQVVRGRLPFKVQQPLLACVLLLRKRDEFCLLAVPAPTSFLLMPNTFSSTTSSEWVPIAALQPAVFSNFELLMVLVGVAPALSRHSPQRERSWRVLSGRRALPLLGITRETSQTPPAVLVVFLFLCIFLLPLLVTGLLVNFTIVRVHHSVCVWCMYLCM